jgi:hypothetical protein
MAFTFGVPQGPTLIAGFAAPNDGFAELEDGYAPSWAADNDECITAFSGASVTLTYAPLPPETPVCSVAIDCTTASVTCQSTPEVFQLFEGSTSGRLVGTFDATGGATPVFTDASSALTDTYYACTMNSAGATACTSVPEISALACPAPPPPPPPTATSIAIETSPFWSGSTVTAVITLNEAAPAGGTWVELSTSDPLNQGRPTGLTVPWEVTVPAGATSVTFPITAAASALTSSVLTATLATSTYATMVTTTNGPFLLTGGDGVLELYFKTPTPSGASVSFTSTAPSVAEIPATLALTPGATKQSVPVTRRAYGSDAVTATYEGIDSSADVYFILTPKVPPGGNCTGICQ